MNVNREPDRGDRVTYSRRAVEHAAFPMAAARPNRQGEIVYVAPDAGFVGHVPQAFVVWDDKPERPISIRLDFLQLAAK